MSWNTLSQLRKSVESMQHRCETVVRSSSEFSESQKKATSSINLEFVQEIFEFILE